MWNQKLNNTVVSLRSLHYSTGILSAIKIVLQRKNYGCYASWSMVSFGASTGSSAGSSALGLVFLMLN
jgi:hypothetical protein